MGLEPTVSCLASRRVNQLRYNRTHKAARGTRTPNLLITSELHYHCAMTANARCLATIAAAVCPCLPSRIRFRLPFRFNATPDLQQVRRVTKWTWRESNPRPKLILNIIVYAVRYSTGQSYSTTLSLVRIRKLRLTVVSDPQQLLLTSYCVLEAKPNQAAILYSQFAFIFCFDDNVITRAQLYLSKPRRNLYKPIKMCINAALHARPSDFFSS